jgi:hypothetical protein
MENVKRVISKFYSRKHITVSVRLDTPTYMIVEDMKKVFDLNSSELFRLSIWLLAILLDPNVTLKQVLTDEAIGKLCRGDNVTLVDALRSLGDILEEKVKEYYKLYKEL